jgi:hypothetical protein
VYTNASTMPKELITRKLSPPVVFFAQPSEKRDAPDYGGPASSCQRLGRKIHAWSCTTPCVRGNRESLGSLNCGYLSLLYRAVSERNSGEDVGVASLSLTNGITHQ